MVVCMKSSLRINQQNLYLQPFTLVTFLIFAGISFHPLDRMQTLHKFKYVLISEMKNDNDNLAAEFENEKKFTLQKGDVSLW